MRIPCSFLLLVLCSFLWAQPAEPDVHGGTEGRATVPAGKVDLRTFDEAELGKLRDRYDYERDVRRVPTFWERFKAWVLAWLQRILGTRLGAMVTDNLLYLFIIVALLFALYILSKGGLQRIFHGAPRPIGSVAVSEEDIREMDLSELLRRAEEEGDLRRAIRLHYLLVLRGLVEQGVLEWHPHSTDQEYMAQIKDTDLRARFSRVALVFQWVWYGQADVDPADYDELRRPFIQFEIGKAA